MTDFAIRVASAADEQAVSELLARSYPPLLAGHYDAELLARALPAMIRAQPHLLASGTYYLAVTTAEASPAGRVVGCGGWTAAQPGTTDEVEAGVAHLRHFATDPAFTRRGVGRALVERCFADAAAAGCPAFECWSTLAAEPFYASLGFARVELRAVSMPPDLEFPSVRMRRPPAP